MTGVISSNRTAPGGLGLSQALFSMTGISILISSQALSNVLWKLKSWPRYIPMHILSWTDVSDQVQVRFHI